MNKLKVRSYGMMASIGTLGNASSWAFCIHHLSNAFLKQGHELFLNTTNGVKGVPKNLLKYFRDCPDPDIDFCYTLMQNFPHRFSGILAGTKKAKIRCGILNYESSILPQDWAQYHQYVDYLLPSSDYCADIFRKAGIPSNKIVVLPLGIDFDALNAPIDNFELKTNKKFKLLNVSINHARKNIPLLIDAYFEEFSESDDICLVLKTTLAPKKEMFEIDVGQALNEIKAKHAGRRLPEIEVVDHRFNNIATIYKKCNGLICVSASEGWFLPGLESLYCGMLVSAPRYSGQLDFLEHNKNSLLIDTIEINAPPEYQYWASHPNAVVGMPVKESIMATMRQMYKNETEFKIKFAENVKATINKYTWDNSVQIIIDLYDGKIPKKIKGELI